MAGQAPHIPVIAFGMSLGIFLTVTYVLCVGFDLLFPGQAIPSGHVAGGRSLFLAAKASSSPRAYVR